MYLYQKMLEHLPIHLCLFTKHLYNTVLAYVEKAMVTHSSTLLSDFTFTFMHWRRKWQPTPAFLPGESQGWGSLVGCRLWGRTESDMTEAT